MSIETSQKLKAQLTDKFVVVKPGVPELRRFASLTGVVKTVNMSGRALVQFDGPADIGWYDIDPNFLVVVDAPVKKSAAEKHAAPAQPAEPKKPGGAGPKIPGKSPLEMARAQGAAGTPAAAASAPAPAAKPPAAPAAAGAKKLSPLEMARQQGAMKEGAAKPAPSAAKPAAPAPATAAKAEPAPPTQPVAPGKKLSPLEIARMQDAGKGECLSTPATVASASAPTLPGNGAAAEEKTPSPAHAGPTPAVAPTPKPAVPSGKKLSPLELARQQGAFKPQD